MTERRYELDWLRVLAVILLVFFHSGRVFDFGDFYVKNGVLNVGIQIFVSFVSVWFMPLFFLIAGGAAYEGVRPSPTTCPNRPLTLNLPGAGAIFESVPRRATRGRRRSFLIRGGRSSVG
jgi:hypothetical protein